MPLPNFFLIGLQLFIGIVLPFIGIFLFKILITEQRNFNNLFKDFLFAFGWGLSFFPLALMYEIYQNIAVIFILIVIAIIFTIKIIQSHYKQATLIRGITYLLLLSVGIFVLLNFEPLMKYLKISHASFNRECHNDYSEPDYDCIFKNNYSELKDEYYTCVDQSSMFDESLARHNCFYNMSYRLQELENQGIKKIYIFNFTLLMIQIILVLIAWSIYREIIKKSSQQLKI